MVGCRSERHQIENSIDEGNMKLFKSFLPAGNLSGGIAKHLEKPTRKEVVSADSRLKEDEEKAEEEGLQRHHLDVNDIYGGSDCEEQSRGEHRLSPATLIKYQRKGLSTCRL